MNLIKAFGAFWYDFVIGDDWQVAAFVVAGLALTASCAHAAGVNAWWLLPLFVFAALAWSLHRATKSSRPLSRTVPAFPPTPSSPPTGPAPHRPSPAPGNPPAPAQPAQETPRRARSSPHPPLPAAPTQTRRKKTRPLGRIFFRLIPSDRNV